MHSIAQSFKLRIILSFTLSVSLLLLPNVSLLTSDAAQGTASAKGRPKWTRPEGAFPDLEDIKRESQVRREPAAPIPSNKRLKKNEGKPWDGRRVGEPFTPGQLDQVAVNQTARGSRLLRRAHAGARFAPQPTFYESQFIDNFFSIALQHSATPEESLYWIYLLRAGHGQSALSLKLAATELGRTLFESASYAARNRDAHGYVYDLYKTYLMRDPDAGGWTMWEGLVATQGREYVRRGFEESGEFATLIGSMVPSGAPGAAASSLTSARVDPSNQPGNGMLTRDVSWSVPLLSLPGRNGLNLGLTLSYSSLVWTRSGPYFYFDEDKGFPSPGFRLGFPTVQRKAFDAQTGKNSYLMLTPSGHRVDLRQVDSSAVYEAADSSYLQLTENAGHLLARSTDGTQLILVETNGEYRCTQIKDRNGNYLTVNYNSLGQLNTITDTLGRVITFNYDMNHNLLSITQAWQGQPQHQWVGFGWSAPTMQYSFASDRVIGTKDGETVPVITQVTLNDTSHFTFEYTNALQVSAIKHYFGTLERNATTFVYQTASGDVPRLLSSSVSARNWSGYNNVPASVTTHYSVAGDGACVLTAPDGTVYKTYYGTGWQKGLTVRSEVWSGGVQQKWTTTTWTQDNESVSYPLNPRVTATRVHDAGNQRLTTIHYSNSSYAQYGLPSEVREYAADASTVIRQTLTDYNLSQAYLDRRIIGLVSQVQVTNGSGYVSKTTYAYDDPARLEALPPSVTQHDTSYSTSLTARGNVTSVSRWDVNDIINPSKQLTSFTNYFVTGAPASATDPAGHFSSISYADGFSDNLPRNTFAYPTTVTDADNHSSHLQYNFDLGATTRTESPAPAGQTQGAIQTMTYNHLGQLERVTTLNNGAYQRFWYGAEFTASYATVNNVADELYSVQVTDGHGRVIGALRDHPGSNLGYSLVHSVYDLMGRTWLQSNPAEVNSSWSTTGGDDAAGLYYTQQTYDWKGRPLVTTHPDLTTKTASYAGCGCAGGAVVTLTDEGTLIGGVTKKRQQRIYADVLGRTFKSETLNWDGPGPNGTDGTVYATTTTEYNARDQVTKIRQYAGPLTSSTYQDTTMTYDGYGRLETQHRPEQFATANNSASSDHTTFHYNADDMVASIVDPRGVRTHFSYNNRHLTTGITYDVSHIPEPFDDLTPTTAAQSFVYDAAGNRTSMTDGTGTTDYEYNSLSRLTSEKRKFAGPFFTTPFILTYGYNLLGEISSLTLPSQFGTGLTYVHDTAGRLTSVTGSGYVYNNTMTTQASISSFLSNATYRAWNDLKQMNTGNSSQTNFAYDQNLRPTSYSLTAGSSSFTWSYQYYADSSTRMVSDSANNQFDKAFSYDHAGRMTDAFSGREARGLPVATPSPDSPFRQTFEYNAFNQQVRETGRIWQREMSGQMLSFTNNRRVGLGYDSAGQVIADAQGSHVFDAAGQRVRATAGIVGGDETGHPEMPGEDRSMTYDADGQPARNVLVTRREELVGGGPQTWWAEETETTYYLRSSALGGYVVGELNAQGQRVKEYIYAGGERFLEQSNSNGYITLNWQHKNPLTDSWISVDPNGMNSFRSEVDAHGRETGIEAPMILPNEPPPPPTRSPSYLEMAGAPTIEAELGMQLYEDIYIAKIFDNGYGPGQGGYDRLRTIREFHLQAGGKFALGFPWFDLPGSSFQEYESVGDSEEFGWKEREYNVEVKYYRLKPGAGKRIGPQIDRVPLTDTQVQTLEANLKKFLKDKDCSNFINAMLKSLPNDIRWTTRYTGSLLDNFNRIKNRGGYWTGDTISKKAVATTNPNTMLTTFDSERITPLITGTSSGQFGSTVILIHELTHIFTNAPNAGVYDHGPMADAALAAVTELKLDVKTNLKLDFPEAKNYKDPEEFDVALSEYFNRSLNYACRKVKL